MKRIIAFILVALTSLLCLNSCFLFPSDTPDDENKGNGENEAVYLGTVSGVISENGKALSGVCIKSGSRETETDKNGKYSIEIYDDGLTVSFTKEGYFTQKHTFKSSSFYRDEIDLSFAMFLSVKVSGYVKSEGGVGIEGAMVSIGDQTTVTDSDGYYEFESVIGTSMVIIATKDGKTSRTGIFTEDMTSGECVANDIIIK